MIVRIDLLRCSSAWPVSVNKMYTDRHRLRKGARAWRNHVRDFVGYAWVGLLPEERRALEAAPVWRITLTWCWGKYQQPGDLDNYRKLVHDGIEQATWRNDRCYRGVDATEPGADPRLTITIEPLEE